MTKLSEFLEQYYYGPEGETLFYRPYQRKIVVHDDLFDLIFSRDENLDERSLALVSAMISENYIDRILKLLLPTFELNRQGAASSKISLLAAFNIIPKHLTNAAVLVNKTRNEFAHNLNLTSFSELDHHKPEITRKMRDLCKSRKMAVHDTNSEIRTLFDVIFQMATAGIIRFEENVRFYAEFTRTPQFIKAIENIHSTEVRSHNNALMEALQAHQSAPIMDGPPAIA
jgi:hypothetical protein